MYRWTARWGAQQTGPVRETGGERDGWMERVRWAGEADDRRREWDG